jgi:glyoxylase-like metal-dependent hydrolase (beta-lactamase superfamily II)/rhodanese-related sulfurtransferase
MSLFFRQYYLGCLSHASYLVGDTETGVAAVVDPQRDIAQYLDDAAANGLTIRYAIETHFHADFLSGHLGLAEQVGAEIVFGKEAEGRTEFPIRAMADGERIALGRPGEGVELEILETPGHTPESICIVVREHPDDEVPYGVLTGDTLFIGDVGRPDLLAAVGHTADDLARLLYRSLHTKLLTLPDETRVFPAHGAGSACGKNLSTETVSTIGEQRRHNYALAPMSESDFVDAVTQGQAAAPLYFLFAATKNRQAHETFDETEPVTMLDLEAVLAAQRDGAVVVDCRDEAEFAAAHLRGSINVGLGGRFAEYAGEVVRPGTPIVIVAEPGYEQEAKVRLARIGFDHVLGALEHPLSAFVSRPELVERASRLTVDDLSGRLADLDQVQLVDVRGPGETALGTIPGARVVELPALLNRLDELDAHLPTVVYCAGGYRSSIAASTLRRHGFTDVSDLIGGITAWSTAGQPIAQPSASS